MFAKYIIFPTSGSEAELVDVLQPNSKNRLKEPIATYRYTKHSLLLGKEVTFTPTIYKNLQQWEALKEK